MLEKIINEAKTTFENISNEGKILTWESHGNPYNLTYNICNEKKFLDIIRNRYNLMIKDIEDSEEIENIDFDEVMRTEFDFEYRGWTEYFDPYEKLSNDDYKYCYLIIFNIHVGTPQQILETIVYSNNQIHSQDEMTDILKAKGIDIPGEFNIEWANHYFNEIHDIDKDDLYTFGNEDYEQKHEIKTVYVD